MSESNPKILFSNQSSDLHGKVVVPGDKSISHRAIMFGSIAIGETRIQGLLESEDTIKTLEAMRSLGVNIKYNNDAKEDCWIINGRGVGGLLEPNNVIDMGNAGTGSRLLLGLLSGYDFKTTITGDSSLRTRPMNRVMQPLYEMGSRFEARDGGLLPITVKGSFNLVPINYTLPVPSAQVKSSILLAGLHTRGETTVIESVKTRDHTEKMLHHFGAQITSEPYKKINGSNAITIKGLEELVATNVLVPGDPSSAAFLVVAALISEKSEIVLENVGLNPRRIGIFHILQKMGADLTIEKSEGLSAEPIGKITARHSNLIGIDVLEKEASFLIDEFPILSIAAACANGKTVMKGLAELRYKESDRLSSICEGLNICGVNAKIDGDNLIIFGSSGKVKGGGLVSTHFDHRIAMAFLILGFNSISPIGVDDISSISTSYPSFFADMGHIGANLTSVDPSQIDNFLNKKY